MTWSNLNINQDGGLTLPLLKVVAATPGRLLELLECRQIELSHVTSWVLAEADKMLEMGFEVAIGLGLGLGQFDSDC